MLAEAVEEEVRRSEGRVDGAQLLRRARGALDEIARPAHEEYTAYRQAEADSAPGRLLDRFGREALGGLAGAAGAAALATLLLVAGRDESTATAVRDAGLVALAAVLGFTLRAVAAHLWSAERQAGSRHQPGGVDQLRLAWRSALDVRGIRPYLEQQRALAPRRDATGRGAGSGRATAARRPAPGTGRARPAPVRCWPVPSTGCPTGAIRSSAAAASSPSSPSGSTGTAPAPTPGPPSSCCTARPAPGAPCWRAGPPMRPASCSGVPAWWTCAARARTRFPPATRSST